MLSSREKELLHKLFSPESLRNLIQLFPDTREMEWESLYSTLLSRRSDGANLVLYVDGASDARKGTAGIGGILYPAGHRGDEGEQMVTFSENIGKATSNQAEYAALIEGLERARQANGKRISIYSDSELMVRQLKLEYRVRSDRILPFYRRATTLLNEFDSWSIHHIPRESNKRADTLSKQALAERKQDSL